MARKQSSAKRKRKKDGDMDEAKKTVLEKALKDITKRYGEGSIMRLGQAKHLAVEAIPTGSLSLDIALGLRRTPCQENTSEQKG